MVVVVLWLCVVVVVCAHVARRWGWLGVEAVLQRWWWRRVAGRAATTTAAEKVTNSAAALPCTPSNPLWCWGGSGSSTPPPCASSNPLWCWRGGGGETHAEVFKNTVCGARGG